MINKYIKHSFWFVIILFGLWVAWMFLPEKLYEWIADVRNTEIVSQSTNDLLNQKRTTLFLIAFGLCFPLQKNFVRINTNLINFFLASIIVFLGFFIGVYSCFALYDHKVGTVRQISIDNCLNIFIIGPLIILMLFGFNYLFKRRKISNVQQ